MAAEIEHGDWVIGRVDGKTFLKAAMKKLNIPEESQVLVFSKTSFQNSLTNQNNPRSIYFSMDAKRWLGAWWEVEVIIEDKKLGPVFIPLIYLLVIVGPKLFVQPTLVYNATQLPGLLECRECLFDRLCRIRIVILF